MDNLFVVVEEYDHYQFKESKVTHSQLYSVVGDIKCIIDSLANNVFCAGGDVNGVAAACRQTPLD